MAILDLLQTQTFRDWFNKTNEIIDVLNSATLANGVVANGSFTVNGSLLVVNTFFANSSLVDLRGNTTVTANTVVSSRCNTWNFACGALTIQPLSGTVVNTGMTWSATAPVTFNGPISANSNVGITADISQTGNTFINGTFTSNNGPAIVRQVLMASSNAIAAATLASPEFDDFAPSGLNEASLVNLTPTIDTTITGIQAPTNFAAGARVLILQNLATAFNVTFVSANTNSGINNRLKFAGDNPVTLPPGGAITLVWTSINKEWRGAAGAQAATFPSLTVSGLTTLSGNVIVGGWLNVAHQLVVSGNAAITGNTSVTGFVNIASTLQVTGQAVIGAIVVPGSLICNSIAFQTFANTIVTSGMTLSVTGNTSLQNTITNWLTVSGVLTASLNASALVSGTIPTGAFPNPLPAISGVNLTNLNASNLGAGTVPDARFPAALPAINGVNLTTLNAAVLAGNQPWATLPAGGGTWTASPTIAGAMAVTSWFTALNVTTGVVTTSEFLAGGNAHVLDCFTTALCSSMTAYQVKALETTWTAPSDGFAVLINNGNEGGSLHIDGVTLIVVENSVPNSACFPVAKGHTYGGFRGPGGSGLLLVWVPFGTSG